jgi:hypothetical protein
MSMEAFTKKIITRNSVIHLPVYKQFLNIESCPKLLRNSVKLQSVSKNHFSYKDAQNSLFSRKSHFEVEIIQKRGNFLPILFVKIVGIAIVFQY